MKKIVLILLVSIAAISTLHLRNKMQRSPVTFSIDNDEELGAGEDDGEEGKKQDQPDKFFLYHQGIRTRDGEIAPTYPAHYKWIELQRMRENAFARQRITGRSQSNGVMEWKERGPGNVPGRTRALFNVPGDPAMNTWLAGAATGGIWRTTDGGLTWTEVSGDFPALPISSFSGTNSGNVIYAGTGEFMSSFYSAIGNGIFKSTDMGLTWSQLPATDNNPDFSIITRLVVQPANPNVIVATTVPHNMSASTTSSIMRTTDGGQTWTRVLQVTGSLEQVIATPGAFNIQYATQNGVGIWKSVNAGATWNLIEDALIPMGRIELSVSRVDRNVLFASVEGSVSGTGSDLYYSDDQGATWSLVDVRFASKTVDFLEGQGFYDNTIICDPFDMNKVYYGGVSLFATTLTSGSTFVNTFHFKETATESFLFLQPFANIPYDGNRLLVGSFNNQITVEIRFGPGRSQRAHRFRVPQGATSNVEPGSYTYVSYSMVPFEVWDVTNNRQLMVSFRDQNRNGKFDLEPFDDEPAREYVYVHNVAYHPTLPNANISQAGGQEYRLMYNFFPALAKNATWTPSSLPDSKLTIQHKRFERLKANTVVVADGRGSFDGKNGSDQVNLHQGVHPDHHRMLALISSEAAKKFRILLANDGGVFVSKASTTPGTSEGDWLFRGFGLNTGQFYGADKRPGAQQYIGGLQDNGTRISPFDTDATAQSQYQYALGGDGFEVIWHSKDPRKVLGSVYNGQIFKSSDGGMSWQGGADGLIPGNEFGFVTRLANSKNFPDRVFTAGSSGVYVSENFGDDWSLTPIPDEFVGPDRSATFVDVEVSRANANIVWAGSGMFNSAAQRSIFVSTDAGKTFVPTNNFSDVPMGTITKLASHPVDQNTAYAIFSFANAPKILRTRDLGQTWEDITGFGNGSSSINGFPDVAVYCLYVRPDNPNILWAGTEIGIVESLDNGKNWSIIADFPKVSVWDMKGQDNEVVIATHGRGIWTATIDSDQSPSSASAIIASGTSPSGALMLRASMPTTFDSIQVSIDGQILHTIRQPMIGAMDIKIDNIDTGEHSVSLISFKGNNPSQSPVQLIKQLGLLPVKEEYATYFETTDDLLLDGLTLQSFPNVSSVVRKSLMTDHPYQTNKQYQVQLRTPITVSDSLAGFYYSDVALTEPDSDLVTVEATVNGLDWISLCPAYSAADFPGWSEAVVGSPLLLEEHELDLSGHFAPGDTLLFRLSMTSGPEQTSWGWAIDYISIQRQPKIPASQPVVMPITVYPNPTTGAFSVEYKLDSPATVTLQVVDMFGRTVLREGLGAKPAGIQTKDIDLWPNAAGSYIIMLSTPDQKFLSRLQVKR